MRQREAFRPGGRFTCSPVAFGVPLGFDLTVVVNAPQEVRLACPLFLSPPLSWVLYCDFILTCWLFDDCVVGSGPGN